MSQATHETLPDGAIRVCLGGVCGTVSSWHLVEVKERQLVELVGKAWERSRAGKLTRECSSPPSH
jgi:hypothetical protein